MTKPNNKFKLTNVVLYSKGWYKRSDNIWNDLKEILKLDDYTPYTNNDVYIIILHAVQESEFRWCELTQVMIGIHPTECWKYGYYIKNGRPPINLSSGALPEYDMPTAFLYYVLNNLRFLTNDQWIVKSPKWTKFPKNPDVSTKQLLEIFNKKELKI